MAKWLINILYVLPFVSFGKEYKAAQFNIAPNDKIIQTEKIQKAIISIHRSGGGTLLFDQKGVILTGSIYLKSGVHLKMNEGVILRGSKEAKDYHVEKPHLIYALNEKNIGISGDGTIEGQGKTFFKMPEGKHWEPLAFRPYQWIRFLDCENIKISGLLLTDAPSHTLVFDNCNNVEVHDLQIINDYRSPNTDGIDIHGGNNYNITNCIIETGDDAVCLKAGKYFLQNVKVHNCKLSSDDAAIKYGTGSEKSIRNCIFENIEIYDSRYGITMFNTQSGSYSNGTFKNIQISTKTLHEFEYPVFIDIHPRSDEYACGKIENFTFENIFIKSGGNVIVGGQLESLIKNINFKNIIFELEDILSVKDKKSRKPRGNKSFQDNPKWKDLSRQNGHVVIGYAENITFENLIIRYKNDEIMMKDDREKLLTIDASVHIR